MGISHAGDCSPRTCWPDTTAAFWPRSPCVSEKRTVWPGTSQIVAWTRLPAERGPGRGWGGTDSCAWHGDVSSVVSWLELEPAERRRRRSRGVAHPERLLVVKLPAMTPEELQGVPLRGGVWGPAGVGKRWTISSNALVARS